MENFLFILLAVVTSLLIWDTFKEAWKKTNHQLNNSDNKKVEYNSALTSEERQKLSKDFEQDNSPFVVGPPVRYGHFFGREEIIQSLFNLWKGFPMQNVAIYGEKRIGKTSLLRYLKDVVDNPDDSRLRKGQKTDWLPNSEQYCFIYVDFQDVEFHSQKRLLEYILRNMRLEKAEGLDFVLSEDNPLLDFGRILSNHLVRPTVILMDEIGILLEHHSEEFSHNFWDGLRAIATTKLEPQCLGFVLASNKNPNELGELISEGGSPFIDIFSNVIELKKFTEVEARELIASSPKPFSDVDVRSILDESEYKPYILQKLCQTHFNYLFLEKK
ncbi:ATP-binding protein [Candidatus Halobeggiatoa sp. HSG11]|nr:ATP-binding protein [Candidatus Halobeggiatoa sp. HSG11]